MTDPTACGDPVSGIGCPVRDCTHDNPADPNVAAYTAAFNQET